MKRSRKLHPKGLRSHGRRKRIGSGRTTEGVQAPSHRDIDLPEIFVRVDSGDRWSGKRYAQARIVLRRRVYRYLVWKENGRKRMLYLGKIKIRVLQPISCSSPAPAPGLEQNGGQE
jgi:hypothetical protein